MAPAAVVVRVANEGPPRAFETDSVGTTVGRQYFWGPGTDDLRAATDPSDGKRYFAITDKLGSIRAWVSQAGVRGGGWRYSPYGTTLTVVGGVGTHFPYRWTGREYDGETGFYFNRARYYDPKQGRFTQEDPIGLAGGRNLYAYVDGQPLETRDPTGLMKDYESFVSMEFAMGSLDFLGQIRSSWEDAFSAYSSLAQMDLNRQVRAILKSLGGGGRVEVGCRSIPRTLDLGDHCAIRLYSADGKISRILEMLGDGGVMGFENHVLSDAQAGKYSWAEVGTPQGMTTRQFVEGIVFRWELLRANMDGQTYHSDGTRNSNFMVWWTITGAGGSMPKSVHRPGQLTPGICGGYQGPPTDMLASYLDPGPNCS